MTMKPIQSIVFLFLLVGMLACKKDKDDEIKTQNPTVDEYVQSLKSGQYHELALPDFSAADIPALLAYRNETQIITNFPHNPLSSLYGSECRLGVYVLWTIEAIRKREAGAVAYEKDFPSLNPILGYSDLLMSSQPSPEQAHPVVAQAYYNWWEQNKDQDFKDFCSIDPLGKTDYRWF